MDEEKKNENNFKYNEIFKLLKINSFISKEYLYPIYEYFSDLYHNMNEIDEKDLRLKKIDKVFALMNIFYDFDIITKELKENNANSYCFIGGGLKVHFSKDISLMENQFEIRIDLLNTKFFAYTKNFIVFRNKDIKIENDCKHSKDIIKEKKNIIIHIIFFHKKTEFTIIDSENIKLFKLAYDKEIKNINTFYLLENFYGQVKSIEFKIIKKKSNNKKDDSLLFDEIFEPYILSDDGYLSHRDNNKFTQINNYIDDNENNSIVEMNVVNKSLFKSNYINYLDKNFDFIEYFGGITPFVPFIQLINGINKNTKINLSEKSIFLKKKFGGKKINLHLLLLVKINMFG